MVQQKEIFRDKTDILEIKEDEFNLCFIDGTFGHGKTIFLTWLGINSNYKKIYADYEINDKRCVNIYPLTADKLLELNWDRKHTALLLLHEAYKYFDRRLCMKKENKETTETLFQIRKLNTDIAGDIPDLDYLDFRCTDHGNLFFKAIGQLKHFPKRFLFCPAYPVKMYDGYEFYYQRERTFDIDMSNIYDKYNTFERKIKRQRRLISL